MDRGILEVAAIVSVLFFIILSAGANAVDITDLSITDRLNTDLSMRETILIHVENNSDGIFKLSLPALAYDILYNGSEIALDNVSRMLECDNCTGNITYSFSGIVQNDSENYTFFRKIDMPINVSDLDYIIILPENYTLYDTNNLAQSIMPTLALIKDNRTIEWHYPSPQFPKDFAVRYRKEVPKGSSFDLSGYLVYMIIIIVILAVLLIGIYLGHKIRRNRKKKKKIDYNFKEI